MDERLSEFGHLFIEAVRDNTLFVLEAIIDGSMKGDVNRQMHDEIRELPSETIDLIRDFSYRAVDLCLHNMLFMFEENDEWKLSKPSAGISDLKQISDGFPGKLYTADGWIRRFSEYKPSRGL